MAKVKSKSVKRREAIQNKLLQCPFCENEAPELILLDEIWFARCERCNCEGPSSLDKKIAIEIWNKPDRQDWHYCHKCQKERGGKEPKGPNCVTAMNGKCSRCKESNKTLIPNADYIWRGQTYVWD